MAGRTNIWQIKNLPKGHPARTKITQYAKENHMEIAGVIIKLANRL